MPLWWRAATGRVRMWRGGLRFSLLLPPLSSGGASIAKPSLRFHILLVEPDRPISGIRLSDKTHNLRTRKVIRRSPDPQHEAVLPRRAATKHSAHNRQCHHLGGHSLPEKKPGSFFASACDAFRSFRTLPEFHRVAPISCASLLSAPVLNQGPFPPPALPGFSSITSLSATP